MPRLTQGEILRNQGLEIATLIERLDHVRRDLARIEEHVDRVDERSATEDRRLHDLERRLSILERDALNFDRGRDDSSARRWDLWKLVLAALLGSLLTTGAGLVSKSLDRLLFPAAARKP